MVLTSSQLQKELVNRGVELSPPPVDVSYRIVPEKWYRKKFLPWWGNSREAFEFYAGKWKEESNDCDDYAYRFRQALRDSNALRPVSPPSSAAAGVAIVRMRVSAMGVSSGGLHACNLIRVERGWVVVEPQNGAEILLSAYPNPFVRAEF